MMRKLGNKAIEFFLGLLLIIMYIVIYCLGIGLVITILYFIVAVNVKMVNFFTKMIDLGWPVMQEYKRTITHDKGKVDDVWI